MPTITQRVEKRVRELGGEIYDHDEWGSRHKTTYASRRRTRPVRIKQADTWVGHISVTRSAGDSVAAFFEDMRAVEAIGASRFGSGFSYNFGIRNGRIGIGQPLDAKGTHTINKLGRRGFSYDQNHAARAFVFIGMPGEVFTEENRKAAVILTAAMILEDALTEDPDTLPHSFFAAKDCPCDSLRDQLSGILREAQELVKKVRAGETPETPEEPEEPEAPKPPKFVRDLGANFWAATWNVHYSTPIAKLEPILRKLREDGVSLFLIQEASRRSVRNMLIQNGLDLVFEPRQYVIAWDPEVWELVESDGFLLSDQRYSKRGPGTQQTSAVRAILRHRETGRTVDALSYHPPAGVQRKGKPTRVAKRRLRALRESMEHLTKLARERRADAVLYGGDDNVDESRAPRAWSWMLFPVTRLRQVQAPAGTHGKRKLKEKGRKIDDFRVKRLKVRRGYVVDGGGDHAVHVRLFRFAYRFNIVPTTEAKRRK